MSSHDQGLKRREFLKYGALFGAGAFASASWPWLASAASKERLSVLSSISLDTLNPYAISASPHYGIWQHMIEPLVEVDYARKEYTGVLAERWEFQGKNGCFICARGFVFTTAARLRQRM
jgi:ABC-type transport system substrate-binding protein